MLVLSGFAESMRDQNDIIKGNKYEFNLFCQNENLDEQLTSIEEYMNNKGWDNIVINQQELLEDVSDINHEVLLDAYQLAITEGISGVVNKNPIAA